MVLRYVCGSPFITRPTTPVSNGPRNSGRVAWPDFRIATPTMINKLGTLFYRWIEAIGTGSDVAQAAQVAGLTTAAGAVSPCILGTVGVGLGIWATYESFQSWAEAKTTEEIKSYLLTQTAGLRGAAEELEIRHGTQLSDLAADDTRRPWLVFATAIKADQQQFAVRLMSALSVNSDLVRELGSFLTQQDQVLRQEQGDLLREVEFARDDLIDLQAWLDGQFKALTDRLVAERHAPPLELFLLKATSSPRSESLSKRFHFRRRRVPLAGRDEGLAKGEQFLSGEHPSIAWWLWTGAGGQGKSRLALELCLRAQSMGWWAGFLPSAKLQDQNYVGWDRWQVDRPTLIVVDYLAGRAKEVGHAIAIMLTRALETRHPVRFLLLERGLNEQTDTWWRDFSQPGTAGDAIQLEEARFAPPWELPAVNDDALWSIMSTVLKEVAGPLPDKQSMLQRFRQIDPQTRPLLATAFAEACHHGQADFAAMNTSDLAQIILAREVIHWRDHFQIDEAHLHLLTYATITGGHTEESYQQVWDSLPEPVHDILPRPEDVRSDWMHAMTSFGDEDAIQTRQSPAFEPDLLGETLVLQRLAGQHLRFSIQQPSAMALARQTQQLVSAAWEVEPFYTGKFTIRAWHDVPHVPIVDQLLQTPPEDAVGVTAWCMAVCDACSDLIAAGRSEIVAQVLKSLEECSQRDPACTEYWAAFLFNRGVTHGRAGDTALAIANYTACIQLPDAPAQQVASALLNRGVTHGRAGDTALEIADYTACIQLPDAHAELIAQALVNRGVTYGQAGDTALAIADYSACIQLPDAPAQRVAGALVRRGVAYGQRGDTGPANADFTACIQLTDAPTEEVASALVGRGITYGQEGDTSLEIADYSACIQLPDAPAEQVASALIGRGITYGEAGDTALAIADFTACIQLPDAPAQQVASALCSRGISHGLAGDTSLAIADFTDCIQLTGAPPEQVAKSLYNRGVSHEQAGDTALAIADFTDCIQLTGAPPEPVAKSLLNRGVTLGQAGVTALAIADFTTCIQLPDAPAEQVANALYNRGIAHGKAGDTALAIADYNICIQLPDAHAELIAKARIGRGVIHGQAGDTALAIADYTACIQFPDAPAEQVSNALVNRGVIHRRAGDTALAIADYTACIQLPNAPAEQIAKALYNRGIAHEQAGDTALAIADYTACIQLPSAPAEQVAQALYNRGVTHGQAGDTALEIADYTACIQLPEAPAEQIANALVNRGVTHGRAGDTALEIADYTACIQLPDAPAEQIAKARVARGLRYVILGDRISATVDWDSARQLADQYQLAGIHELLDQIRDLERNDGNDHGPGE